MEYCLYKSFTTTTTANSNNNPIISSSLCIGSSIATDQYRYKTWLQAIDRIILSEGEKSIEQEDLMLIAILPFPNSSGYLYQEMKEYLIKVVRDPLLPLLKISYQNFEILVKEAIADTGYHKDFSEQHAKVFSEVVVIQIMYYLKNDGQQNVNQNSKM